VLEKLFPDNYYDSIYDIKLSDLKAEGIKGIIFDLDNTIVPRNLSVATEGLKNWLSRLKDEGFEVCIVSNNWKLRVESIAEQLGVPLVARAAKPRKGAFKRALNILGTGRNETVVVGDQIFTDVLGGNISGLRTVLVMPMSNHEAPHTKILRYLERLVMRRWYKTRAQKGR
jgi:HAD superfamily phosphatase (TIGR01668 family)